jgi:hypothetical protein
MRSRLILGGVALLTAASVALGQVPAESARAKAFEAIERSLKDSSLSLAEYLRVYEEVRRLDSLGVRSGRAPDNMLRTGALLRIIGRVSEEYEHAPSCQRARDEERWVLAADSLLRRGGDTEQKRGQLLSRVRLRIERSCPPARPPNRGVAAAGQVLA